MRKLFYLNLVIILCANLALGQELSPIQTSLTIYQNNYATVKQDVEFNLAGSPATISYNIPSLNIVSESVFFTFKGEILSQSYVQTPDAFEFWLKNGIGKEATILFPNGVSYKGKLSFYNRDAAIFTLEDGKTLLVNDLRNSSIMFNDYPFKEPEPSKITWQLKSNKTGKNTGMLVYHTSGINWRSKYYVYLDEEKQKLSIYNWAMINNKSGMDFNDVNLKIIAGALNIISGSPFYYEPTSTRSEAVFKSVSSFDTEKPLFEYFQYTFHEKITLKNNETKLLKIFTAENVAYKKTYVYYLNSYPLLDSKESPIARINFVNTKQNNLGVLLPSGQMDVYVTDKGNIELIGQSNIQTTPTGDEVSVNVGKVSDISIEVKQAESSSIIQDNYVRKFKLLCHNFKNKEAVVEINYSDPFAFEVLNSNIPPKVVETQKLIFEVPIKANSTFELTFSLQTKK